MRVCVCVCVRDSWHNRGMDNQHVLRPAQEDAREHQSGAGRGDAGQTVGQKADAHLVDTLHVAD